VYILLTLLLVFNQPQFTTPPPPPWRRSTRSRRALAQTMDQSPSARRPYNSNFPIDFNPERDEAICSTLEIKRSYKQTVNPLLPEAARHGQRNTPAGPLDALNTMSSSTTSALAQAFPDFSQAGSPNDTFSLEAPRGRKGKQHTTVTSSALEYTSDAKTP